MSDQIVGMITEYNPFHLGHEYHISETKRLLSADAVVAVMSGSFVQRGEPALLDKWVRAAAAVNGGVDLVIELPALFAVSSAEYFATAGVHLLNQLGFVKQLSFGSESGSLDSLKEAVTTLSHLDAKWLEARNANPELSYPALKAKLMKAEGHSTAETPNDILGIEYLKAIKALGAALSPFTVKRAGHDYHDLTLEEARPETVFSSASAIRNALLSGTLPETMSKTVPAQTMDALIAAEHQYPSSQKRFDLLRYRLLLHTAQSLSQIHDMEDGLPERILAAAATAQDYETLVTAIKSKRHTRSRIERVLAKILLDIPQYELGKNREQLPNYLRVLAFNDRGRELLKRAKKTAGLPILTNVKPTDLNDPLIGHQLQFDLRAAALRAMLCGQAPPVSDFTQAPVYLR